jgi:hypothetical protein
MIMMFGWGVDEFGLVCDGEEDPAGDGDGDGEAEKIENGDGDEDEEGPAAEGENKLFWGDGLLFGG